MSLTSALPLAVANQHQVEKTLVVVLVQLIIIIAVARLFAGLFRRLGQPAVVGEILAGLILGPSFLGAIPQLHGTWEYVFHPQVPGVNDTFSMLSQLGLIFLLFLIGLEFDFGHLKANSVAAVAISGAGIVLPFGLGLLLAHLMFPFVGMQTGKEAGFRLFMGTAMSITAIPILGRIMMELNITRTRLGAVTITSAAIDDAVGWILLATISAMVASGFEAGPTLKMIGLSLGFALLMILVVRPLAKIWIRRVLARNAGQLDVNALAVVIVVLFGCAIATSEIGIFAIFGAFLLGAIVSDETEFRAAVTQRLRDFVTSFFLPIFFTFTGLRTEMGSIGGPAMWGFAAAVLAVAVLGKFGGCMVAARLSGFPARESALIGVMMNTRALMELIVINVGYHLGVIPKSVFAMLVLMAVVTTIMTAPIMMKLIRGSELELLVQESDFGQRRSRRQSHSNPPGPLPAG